MLHSRCHHFLFPLPLKPTLTHHKPPHSLLPPLHHKPNTLHFVSVSALPPWLAQLADAADVGTEGPVELPFTSTPSIFATTDDPSPIQVASSILLTAPSPSSSFAPSAARLNVSNNPSSGVKSIKEEALDSLKALGSAS
ncbi:hypothetical protein ACSQ67_021362 [Phaseolus vulgaris]